MRRPVRSQFVALTLMLGGCYSGFDGASAGGLSGTTGGGTSTGGDETTTGPAPGTTTSGEGGSTSAAASSGPQTGGEASTTGAASTTGIDETSTTEAAMTGSTTGEPPPPPNPDVPDGVPYCDPAKSWDPKWKQLEEDVLEIVNQKRAQGADCHSEGMFGPAGPLTMEPSLRCAARMHSKDMVDRDFFSHTNPDGELPWDRMKKAGYGSYTNAGENIAAGSPTAAGTMDQWMNSDGHCANIMNPDFEQIGVGYYPGGKYGHVWTQVFGTK